MTTVADDWWDGFFDADYLRVFGPFIDDERTEREINDLVDWLGLEPGLDVLDAPCGQGRHAIPLAALGCKVTGMDRSTFLLDRARAAATGFGVDLTLVQGDLREPVATAAFDLVLNLYNSFGYFDSDDDDLRQLRALSAALRPGGRMVMEVANRASDIRNFTPSESAEPEPGLIVALRRALDLETSRMTTTYTLCEADGSRRTIGHVQRLYALHELIALHERVGLTVEHVAGEYDGRRLDLDDDAVVIVSRKLV